MAGVKRLSKVARELNVGITTIVDYLDTQGIEISTNPNTKLEADVYDVLLSQFQSEKNIKEKVDEVRIEREERKAMAMDKKSEEEAPAEETPQAEEAKVEEAVVEAEPVVEAEREAEEAAEELA